MNTRSRQVVNVDEVRLEPRPAPMQPKGELAERYGGTFARLGPVLGAKKLGFSLASVPPGSGETAHQLVNTGTGELRHLAISTLESPVVVEYPDSQKFGVIARIGEDAASPASWFRHNARRESTLDYRDGE